MSAKAAVKRVPARSAASQAASEKNNGAVPRNVALDDPRLFVNRELSLLAFQTRVLEEAEDESNPLLERVRFLSIVGSNLDEFFMVRVAGLKHQIEAGVFDRGPDGLSPNDQLKAIRADITTLLARADQCWRTKLRPELEKAGIVFLDYAHLGGPQRASVNRYFQETVFPTLTPLAFDPGRPFPLISNLSLNLGVSIRDNEGGEHFARVKIPDTLPQMVPVPLAKSRAKKNGEACFIWLEQLVAANLNVLFPGMKIQEAHPFHVTRDADTAIQELEAGDLLESVEEGVWQRRFADVVRLTVDETMSPATLEILKKNLEVDPSDIYKTCGPIALSRLRHIAGLNRPELKFAPFAPALPATLGDDLEQTDMFAAIRHGDVLLHHPFDSFQPVVTFLQQAARDPAVLAIKTTLYRVGRKAPVVEALVEAAENGKQVAALVELKARFDEESNIEWARALEREGVHVVYGLVGLKVHAKVALVVRQEADAIRRYVHLSTGNYNGVTAQLYTDVGMFTCDEQVGADATDLFNFLTGYSAKHNYRKLLVAPINLRQRVEAMIRREIQHQENGDSGHIIVKSNSLIDKRIIGLLYKASQAGVRVDLLVRGMCCLRPGIPGVSHNIRVSSIVGRFLEHSRMFYFHNRGREELYLGSADMMPRNLNRRVETMFPVGDPRLLQYLRTSILDTYLADTVKARHMRPDGKYVRTTRRREGVLSSQEKLLQQAVRVGKAGDGNHNGAV